MAVFYWASRGSEPRLAVAPGRTAVSERWLRWPPSRSCGWHRPRRDRGVHSRALQAVPKAIVWTGKHNVEPLRLLNLLLWVITVAAIRPGLEMVPALACQNRRPVRSDLARGVLAGVVSTMRDDLYRSQRRRQDSRTDLDCGRLRSASGDLLAVDSPDHGTSECSPDPLRICPTLKLPVTRSHCGAAG